MMSTSDGKGATSVLNGIGEAMTVTTEQRREQILTALYERGSVQVRELAEGLGVSEATIRRDLKTLDEEGKLRLVHGGAVLDHPSGYSFRAKAQRNMEAKRVIGRLAAGLVGDHDQVFLDSGTTCFEMIPHLLSRRDLSIIANSQRVALEVEKPGLNVILLGGQYRPDRMDTVGPLATATLEQLRGYVAFISADGIGREFGPAASDIESAHLYGLAVRNAREAVLVVDYTKFAAPSLFRVCPFDAIGRVVTDRRPDAEWADFFARCGIEVICPEWEAAQSTSQRVNEFTS